MQDLSGELIEFLRQTELVTDETLKSVQGLSAAGQGTVESILLDKGLIKDDQLGQIIANLHGWRFVNLRNQSIPMDTLRLIPESVAKVQNAIVFGKSEFGIKIAMVNPGDIGFIHLLQKRIRKPLEIFYATPVDIRAQVHLYRKEIGGAFMQLLEAQKKEAIGGEAKDSAIVQIVDLLISHAYESKASDVHIEPQAEDSSVRYRVDGVMQDIVRIPKQLHDMIITRVKIISKLRTDEHQTPQDGKIHHELDGEGVDIRVSIVPTTKGENVVMRLLAEKSRQFTLDALGFSSRDFEKLRNSIAKPWGMILVTGPTGSGKTTSLYAVLKILNRREVNIATIEDPVEYNLDGISQIQVNNKAKLTFSSGLRSLVRQDPDIIMVGEIRDEETASIAVNSAMTGHLVLSTLHTNDAPTAIPRLLDMDIEPFLLSSTLNVIIAQRLVRKICPKCIQTHETDLVELQNKIPISLLERLARGNSSVTLYKGAGCNLCAHSGYLGRGGIFELLEITDDIRRLMMANTDADTIRKKAIENGMSSMLDDAIAKVLNGLTTVEELMRVVKY